MNIAQKHFEVLRVQEMALIFIQCSFVANAGGNLDTNCSDLLINKPLPQGAPGGVIGILGGIIAAIIIISAMVTVFFIYRRQQKNRADTDNDLIDLPPSHKPPPPEKKTEMKSHLTADDIQVTMG
ncbi:hypothetical protein scyTo_0018652 [Scyliorhinus torazame]|uniref:Uncharacterized protein n=1 Tax=Scyliorhinus torazame TaxID=75743 RepID=A0A401Q037_SCYTO|nr:hypothetical protein [Scyliorhinus torazame]